MSKKTLNAFIARGVESKLASSLAESGLTLTKLKYLKLEELVKLGLTNEVSKSIFKEQRPPIPSKTVVKLLYQSKWTCCVCRDKNKGIIIHHIKEWNISKDHSEENLVVLCLEHHDLAHTKKELSLNLTENKLKELKKLWLEKVSLQDTQIIRGLTVLENPEGWDYFNHNRIFEIYLRKNLSNIHFKTTMVAKKKSWINDLGTLCLTDDDKIHLYHSGDGYLMYFYMAELFDEVLKTLSLVDLTNKFNKSDLGALIQEGSYIGLQAGFYFKNLSEKSEGREQRRLCYYKKAKMKIQFEFDAYEATSISAWGSHLVGHKTSTVIGRIKSIINKKENITITISCLAMGNYFKAHNYKEEKQYPVSPVPASPEKSGSD